MNKYAECGTIECAIYFFKHGIDCENCFKKRKVRFDK